MTLRGSDSALPRLNVNPNEPLLPSSPWLACTATLGRIGLVSPPSQRVMAISSGQPEGTMDCLLCWLIYARSSLAAVAVIVVTCSSLWPVSSIVWAWDQLSGVKVMVSVERLPLLAFSSMATSFSGSLVRCRSKLAVCSPSELTRERIVLKPVRPSGVMMTAA